MIKVEVVVVRIELEKEKYDFLGITNRVLLQV
jgi:hypothetical protein